MGEPLKSVQNVTRLPNACSNPISLTSNNQVSLVRLGYSYVPILLPGSDRCVIEMLFQTIQAAAVDIRSDLYKHIVLSGGSSMYPGLPSRLEKEIKQLHLTRLLNGDPARLNVRFLFYILLAFLLTTPIFAEIQDQDRGSSTSKTHGLPWRCSVGGYHEKSRGFLDFERRVV